MRSEIYTDTTGDWRWRLVDDAGAAVAGSPQGFASYAECLDGLDRVKAWGASLKPQHGIGPLPRDPRSLVGMFDEPSAENFALLALADRLFR